MSATVRIGEIVEALDIQFDEMPSFVDRETGRVETVSEELLSKAERPASEEPDLLDWQKEEWQIAKQIVSTNRFERLPASFDVHEWAIMEDFSRSVKSGEVREDLLRAIHRGGAFRNFKDSVRRHNVESAWFEFREKALRQIAIDWCEENGISWA